ncbi:putative F-box/LRR-repeat protein-like [Capsicum annuum]|nr:putative F-box/LRR-repeat protein-like [Capsicum annuum]
MASVIEQCQVAPPPGGVAELTLPLTYFDHIWLDFHRIRRVLFYKLPITKLNFIQNIIPSLKNSFWTEALNTAVYVINLSPTVALNGDVPDRVWSGKNISYDHLRVFGCKSFVHVPKDERSKLDVKTRQSIFIGYGQDEFGYHFYDSVEKKLVRSRDVVFFEDQTIEDFDKAEKVDSQSSESLVDVDIVPLTTTPEENQVDNEDMIMFRMTSKKLLILQYRKDLKNRWVFWVKYEDGNPIPLYKARLVVKGFNQKKGVDFDELFSPIVKMAAIRVVLGLAASLDLEVEQMDVKTSFLHSDLDGGLLHIVGRGRIVGSWAFVPSYLAEPKDASGEQLAPVLAIQATFFPNLGVSIGFTNHHDVAGDGATIVGFIRTWALLHKFGGHEHFLSKELIPFYDRTRHADLSGKEGFTIAVELIGEVIQKRMEDEEWILNGSWFKELDTVHCNRKLTVAGSPKYDLYAADFGWGRPAKYEIVSIHDDDGISMSLSKSKDFDGDLEIGLSLSKTRMNAFAAIFTRGLSFLLQA